MQTPSAVLLLRRVISLLAISLALSSLTACGAGSVGSSVNAAKCQVACTPPMGTPCEGQDPAACQSQCQAWVEGLAPACVQCIVEHSGFYGRYCPNHCTNCCIQNFGAGGRTSSCVGGSMCSAADENCSGFMFAKSTGSDCASSCATK